MKFDGKTYEDIMLQVKTYLETKQTIALPGGSWCHLCNQEICRHPVKHLNSQKLLLTICILARALEKEREVK
jgi:hypothetical protein